MDRLRQTVVALSAVIALLVSLIGSGAFVGTPINQAADGALSAEPPWSPRPGRPSRSGR